MPRFTEISKSAIYFSTQLISALYLVADPVDEGGAREGDAHFEGHEAVFGKVEVEEGGHGDGGSAELLLMFGEVGTTDVAGSAFVAKTGEEGVHFWRDSLDGGVCWGFWDFLGEGGRGQGVWESFWGDGETFIALSVNWRRGSMLQMDSVECRT